jgi:hypothetical protein
MIKTRGSYVIICPAPAAPRALGHPGRNQARSPCNFAGIASRHLYKPIPEAPNVIGAGLLPFFNGESGSAPAKKEYAGSLCVLAGMGSRLSFLF